MARDFRGVPFSTLPEPTAPDFTFRLRNMLSEIDAWARDTSQGMGRISQGQVPNGSGDPLPGTGIEIPNDIGAVLFVDSGPSLGTDGTVFFWNTTRALLGVGTNAPAARVHLDLDSAVAAKPSSTISGGNAAGSEWSSNVAGLLTAGSGVPDASVDIDEGFPANDADWIRSNGTPPSGFSECIFGLNSVIPLGEGSYTITIRAAKDTTGNPDPGFFIKLYRADGFGEQSADMFPSLTTSFATYTTTITIGPSPSLSGGTGNSIRFRTVGDPKERVLIAAVTVSAGTAGTDLFRWDANSIQSGRISDTGHMGIGTGSDTLDPMLVVESDAAATIGQKIKGFTAQSGNLLEFRDSADALLSRFTSAGVLDAPINTDYAAEHRGAWYFEGNTNTVYCPRIFVNQSGAADGYGLALDDGGGFFGEIQSVGISADRVWQFPNASGVIVLSGGTVTLNLTSTTTLVSSTASVGASFQDSTTSTKRLRFILSGSVGNNTMTLTNTAARNYGLGNLSGFINITGDDPPAVAAGALGKVDLTGQTAGIGSTNLSNTPPAGLYRVDVCAACTTVSGSGAPTLDVNIAWTDVVGATNRNVTAEPGATAWPLPLSATGRSSASMFVQVASGNIAYTTTINAASGSPQYAIYIRVTYLG